MFRLANVAGRAALVHEQSWYDLAEISADASLADPMVAVARHAELHELAAEHGHAAPSGRITDVVLGPPVPRPQKVFGIGLNYRAHAEETKATLPPAPLTFTKFPSCLVGPTSDVVLSGATVDWEVELVVVIGTGGRRIDRTRRGPTSPASRSDRTSRTEPCSASARRRSSALARASTRTVPPGQRWSASTRFADPDDIGLWCDISGERMQGSRSSDLIFSVPELIAYLSAICTLAPGDLIFTGTPSGVGAVRGRYLTPGDVIESGAEIIGALVNRCIS